MKKIIAILFSICVLTQTLSVTLTDSIQLSAIMDLEMAHEDAHHHTLLDFETHHHQEDLIGHQHEEEHEELPFDNHHCCCHASVVFVPLSQSFNEDYSFLDPDFQHQFTYQNLVEQEHVSLAFQPPIVA